MTPPARTNQASRRRKQDRPEPAAGETTAESTEHEAAEEAAEADAPPMAEDQDEQAEATPAKAEPSSAEAAPVDGKRRIQEQLEALKRREVELRRELAIADHPEFGDALRAIEGAAAGLVRVEAKMAQGLSKSEERRKETIGKKLAAVLARRAEIDAQIAELEEELAPLGEARAQSFTSERREALSALAKLLSEHEPSLIAAGLDVSSLVLGLSSWRAAIDELRAESKTD